MKLNIPKITNIDQKILKYFSKKFGENILLIGNVPVILFSILSSQYYQINYISGQFINLNKKIT
jgi:hypothetical protein